MEYYRDIVTQNQKQKHDSVKESDTKMSILLSKNEKLLKEKQELMLEIASMKQDIEERANKKIKFEKNIF